MDQQLLTVQGSGSVSATPDQAVISFNLKHQHTDYAKCVDGLNHLADDFFKSVRSAGIREEQVKMSDFSIDDLNVYSEEQKTRVFWGYAASYSFKLILDLDHKLINRVLNAVSRAAGHIQIGLNFGIKDAEQFKAQALEKAITDAKNKAGIIAKATGVKLGKIQRIDYGRQIMEIRSSHIEMSLSEDVRSFSEDREINPEDVSTQDHVNITWANTG